MLPVDNTAIIRIDRSIRLDEGLNDEGYYNCIDDDNDWNYYYCDSTHTSYENRCNCEDACSENNIENVANICCEIHLQDFRAEIFCKYFLQNLLRDFFAKFFAEILA